MPGRKSHVKAGAVSGGITAAATYFFNYLITCTEHQQQRSTPPSFNWLEFGATTAGGAGLGAIGGIAPDVLEPAIHSYHRKTMHSVATATTITSVVLKKKKKLTRVQKALVNAAGTGYVSHLVLDSKTPRGIPWI